MKLSGFKKKKVYMKVNFSAFVTLHYRSTLMGNQREKFAIISPASEFDNER